MRWYFRNRWVFRAALVAVAIVVAGHLLPASWWYKAEVYVEDQSRDDVVMMTAPREVKREFVGAWSSVVRRLYGTPADPQWRVICDGSGRTQYKKDALIMVHPTLEWWLGEPCYLPPGRYAIETIWEIDPGFFLFPKKRLIVDSNVFEITE